MAKQRARFEHSGTHEVEPIIRRRRVKQDAEMDITPMIDITFLLLIFFLVCSSIDKSSEVELPKARYGTAVPEKNATVITLDVEGDETLVYLGGLDGELLPSDRAAQEKRVEEAILEGLAAGKDIVIIKGEAIAKHGKVSDVAGVVGLVDGVRLFLAVSEKR